MIEKGRVLPTEYAISLVEIVRKQRDYEVGLVNQVTDKTPLVVATDLEGPVIIGDTAMEVMKRFIPNGEEIYRVCYEWYMPRYYETGLGQEAGDIIMALPILLAYGVTGEQIFEVARESKQIKGSQKVIDSVNNRGGLILGVTSAWSQHHRLITEQIGMSGLFGTEFPIDEIRERFESNSDFQLEMETVREFVERFNQINNPAVLTREVDQLIEAFYVNKLGIKFVTNDAEDKSIIGATVNQLKVIGDKGKLDVLKMIRDKKPKVLIAMGDGLNDKLMLAESKWSIGVNGPNAVKGAKIGVITEDMSIVADIIDLIASGKVSDPNEIVEIFKGDGRGIVHLGGEDTPDDLIQKHKEMRKYIRGAAANLG